MLKPVERSETDFVFLQKASLCPPQGNRVFLHSLATSTLPSCRNGGWAGLCGCCAGTLPIAGKQRVDPMYTMLTYLFHSVPTLLAKEEWAEEIRLKLIYIQLTGPQQETQKWKEGNSNLSICSLCSRCLRAQEETLQQSTHFFVLFFPLYFHFWWRCPCQAKLDRAASLFVHFNLALILALVHRSWG